MKSFLKIVFSFAVTILCWGVYGPLLHVGRHKMALLPDDASQFVGLRPFICVGLAYFLIGVLAAGAYLYFRGEQGHWTLSGTLWSFAAGTVGALGALGVIMAFAFGGAPIFVMPLVFGGAPVVNAFLTISMTGKMKEVGSVFLAGLIIVVLGAMVVLVFRPSPSSSGVHEGVEFLDWLLSLASVAIVVVCWGAYGPILHKGQMKMAGSRLRPLVCVGVSYCVVAVLLPGILLGVWEEQSQFTFSGSMWSLAAGAAGAIGALGIIMAFNFGGKPMVVMPLVFGGAPVVSTITTMILKRNIGEVHALFYSGMILVIAGAAIVLVFAPKGQPAAEGQPSTEDSPAEEEADTSESAP